MEQENARHKNEITRLNGIIDAILLQNRLLLKEIDVLRNGTSPKQADSSITTLPNGRSHADSSIATLPNGRNQADSSIATLQNGGNPPNALLPIQVTPIAISRLSNELRNLKNLRSIRHSGVRNMALIIIQAHNGQSCSHRDLRRLTGLSEGGIAKLMISMKKRGLIYRTGYKRFAVSANVKQMLRKIVENKNSFSFLKAA